MLENKKLLILKFFKNHFLIRRLVLLSIDLVLFQLSILISLFIVVNSKNNISYFENILIFNFFNLIIAPLYVFTGHYKSLTRYLNFKDFYKIFLRNIVIILLINLVNFFSFNLFLDLRFSIVLWIFTSLSIGLSKFLIKDFLQSSFLAKNKNSSNVIIFGAGSAGAQLATSLIFENKYKIISFLDENKELWNRFLFGVPIISPSRLNSKKSKIDKILFAIPSINSTDKKRILRNLKNYNIPILEVPSIDDLTSGRAKINALKPIPIEDLLGREKVKPIKSLFGPGIKNKIICITGAGGSIGRELAKQIITLKPKAIISIDNSEPNLYSICEELKNLNKKNIQTKFILCNVMNKEKIKTIFEEEGIEIVFHAAAYKHVPLVELNPLEGLLNNIFTTLGICEVSEETNVEQVILISSDKAIRPTNIMGVSKRISELIIKAFALTEKSKSEEKTLYSMVRFGNVLGSSGSVIPLFKEQISHGGPITLTHEEMTRYFMTIPEAAQLVIQSAFLSKGGDVFLLNMGEPIKILDLAKQLITLSGFTLKDDKNPNGDIPIEISGIRAGEKLFEELLIDGESEPTSHPLIFKANESSIKKDILIKELKKLELKIDEMDEIECFKIVKKLVPEWSTILI